MKHFFVFLFKTSYLVSNKIQKIFFLQIMAVEMVNFYQKNFFESCYNENFSFWFQFSRQAKFSAGLSYGVNLNMARWLII